jgi:RNA polymerase sigma-70 factor (ECF subfamily)
MENNLLDFNELREASYDKVFNFAYRLTKNHDDAEDITQEAYIRAFKSFESYNRSSRFENWIFRIVNNLFLDLIRYRSRRVKSISYDTITLQEDDNEISCFDFSDGKPTPEDQLMGNVLSEDLQTVFNYLSKTERKLIKLASIEGTTHKEIAAILNLPASSMRTRLYRLRKSMQEHLTQLNYNGGKI